MMESTLSSVLNIFLPYAANTRENRNFFRRSTAYTATQKLSTCVGDLSLALMIRLNVFTHMHATKEERGKWENCTRDERTHV